MSLFLFEVKKKSKEDFMILKKITSGFVIQDYDTEKGKFVSQEFIAGDPVEFEDEEGVSVLGSNDPTVEEFMDTYLPFDMVQPD